MLLNKCPWRYCKFDKHAKRHW